LAFRKAPAAIARALAERDYKEATPVQAAVPVISGSGATAAIANGLVETKPTQP